MLLEATSVAGKLAVVDKETGRHLAYLDGNTLSISGGTLESREEITNRIRQSYSVGVVVNQAAREYWSPQVVKEGNSYKVQVEVNY